MLTTVIAILVITLIKPSRDLSTCAEVRLKRFDETKKMLESLFLVECKSFEHLEPVKSDWQGRAR